MDTGDNDRAIGDFDKAIELDPQFAKAYNNRGNAYYRKGDYDQAIVIDPKYADAYTVRGAAYYFLGDSDHAIVDLERALELGLGPRSQEAVEELLKELGQ